MELLKNKKILSLLLLTIGLNNINAMFHHEPEAPQQRKKAREYSPSPLSQTELTELNAIFHHEPQAATIESPQQRKKALKYAPSPLSQTALAESQSEPDLRARNFEEVQRLMQQCRPASCPLTDKILFHKSEEEMEQIRQIRRFESFKQQIESNTIINQKLRSKASNICLFIKINQFRMNMLNSFTTDELLWMLSDYKCQTDGNSILHLLINYNYSQEIIEQVLNKIQNNYVLELILTNKNNEQINILIAAINKNKVEIFRVFFNTLKRSHLINEATILEKLIAIAKNNDNPYINQILGIEKEENDGLDPWEKGLFA
ncbi:TPA: hypothetical protein DEO28_04025 [Candidatus Dependentiae bacterium]|nr:MAG: hypothetical protein UR14_C0006G0042 [candidate division TM6 bacterium GW2011_GWE2_31_21]KKP53535.1 MAG: hypothetical protein UR43_C0004G0076 [candidate division TM6 bacterium GW2011_GWF2_33_332]HBS48224.1 hypothetical protein [Candidatus Dependentiae bacterium]HBZ73650.1 hypothetical protein [Candidatus Dependentiae bacterium]